MAALNTAAEGHVAAPTAGHDSLTPQIMSKQLTQNNGGITGAVRIGSGEAITLHIIDPLSALKPASGLAKPAAARPRRKVRRADEQLKKLSAEDRRADWSGRK